MVTMKSSLLVGLLIVSSNIFGQDVYLIGADKNNNEIIYKSNAHSIHSSLQKTVEAQKEMALDVLAKNQDQSSWKLKSFTLGLGLEGEAGIGPWNLGLAVKQRLVFKRSEEGAL